MSSRSIKLTPMHPPGSQPKEMMPLADWARLMGVRYMTAWKWFQKGKLPTRAAQMPSGMILVERPPQKPDDLHVETWIYARVNSPGEGLGNSEQVKKCELFAHAKGWTIDGVREEVGPSTQPDRPKFQQILQHVGKLHHSRLLMVDPSRLSRLDFTSWDIMLQALGCQIVVLDKTVSLDGSLNDCIHAMRHILDRRWGVKRRALLLSEITKVIGRT